MKLLIYVMKNISKLCVVGIIVLTLIGMIENIYNKGIVLHGINDTEIVKVQTEVHNQWE